MRRARPLLGTFVEIEAEGLPDADLEVAINAAFDAVELVERLMSFHNPDSDLSRINAAEAGREIAVDPQTFNVLEFARELSDASDGAFDITIAPSLVESGFLPEGPAEPMPRGATYRDLQLLPAHRVRWRRKGWADLGGIAKGYAVDYAVAALRFHGVINAVINAGGDLRCFGTPQSIHVRHPDEPTTLMWLGILTDAAFATSAGYFSSVESDNRRINPLVDPKCRSCISWGGSISVAAYDGMTADALTKVIRLKPESAPRILEIFGAQAIVIDREGARCCGRPLLRSAIAAGGQ